MAESHLPDLISEDRVRSSSANDVEPVLASIRDLATQLLKQPAIASDTECRHIMFLIALCEEPDDLDACAGRLLARVRALTGSSLPVPDEAPAAHARPARVLFRL